jgi:hypothetical protein
MSIERQYEIAMDNQRDMLAAEEGSAEVPGYGALVEQVKKLLEVVEAPKFEAGRKEVVRQERKQYFEAKKAIMKIIAP